MSIQVIAYHVGDTAGIFWVQHDNLCGHMTLNSPSHLFHRAVDGWIWCLEPVVRVPTNQKPDILLTKETFLVDLENGMASAIIEQCEWNWCE